MDDVQKMESAVSAARNDPSTAPPEASASLSAEADVLLHSPEVLGPPDGREVPATGESLTVTGSAVESSILDIMEMGFSREQATVAMQASSNNPNRAVEHLLNQGEHLMTSTRPSGTTSESCTGMGDDTHHLHPVLADGLADTPHPDVDDDPLATFASQIQFRQIRQMLSSNSLLLDSFLRQIRRTNPRLHQAIKENPERFQQALNDPLADDGGGGGHGGDGGGGAASIILSQKDHEAVEQLMALGFTQSLCVQAYFAFEKNEELAGDFLLSQEHDDDLD